MTLNDIITNLDNYKNEELVSLQDKISDILKDRNDDVIITLSYNSYKGTGKCWVAVVDKDTKKILNFVENEGHIKNGYKGGKTFKLREGEYYLLCEEGSKSQDNREFVVVRDSELINF